MEEALVINKVFYDKGVPVVVVPTHPRLGHASIYQTPTFTVYEIVPYNRGTRMSSVKALMPELTQALKDKRKVERLSLRWGESPFALEVPNVKQSYIDLDESEWKKLPPYTGIIGRSYAYAQPKEHRIDFTNPNTTNVLIPGINGSGKTNTARQLLLSLAMNNAPEVCRFAIIDPKVKSLEPLRSLPHTLLWADNPYDAHKVVGWVWAEMERRRTEDYNGKLFLVTEELSYLALEDMRDAFERMLPQISLLGRQLDIHLVTISQRPTAKLIGGQLKSQFSVRLVHRMDSADNARIASGRAETGAEALHGFGSFVLIDDEARPAHLQAYYISDIEKTVNEVKVRFGQEPEKVDLSLPAKAVSKRVVAMEEKKERARVVFDKFWDGKKLGQGAQQAILEAVYGEGTRNAGGNRNTVLKVISELTNEKNSPAKPERVSGNNRKRQATPPK